MALTAGLLLQHKHVDPLSVNFCLLKPLQLVFHLDLDSGALKVVQSCPDSNFNRYGQAEFSFVYLFPLFAVLVGPLNCIVRNWDSSQTKPNPGGNLKRIGSRWSRWPEPIWKIEQLFLNVAV